MNEGFIYSLIRTTDVDNNVNVFLNWHFLLLADKKKVDQGKKVRFFLPIEEEMTRKCK